MALLDLRSLFEPTQVGASLAISWRVRVAVGLSRGFSWLVRIAVATSRSASWVVRTTAGVSRLSTWRVRTAVGTSLGTSWRVRLSAGISQGLSWIVRTVVGASLGERWLVAFTPPDPFRGGGRWVPSPIHFAQVASGLDFKYRIAHSVGSSAVFGWGIEPPTEAVPDFWALNREVLLAELDPDLVLAER